jgi:putative flippase GtrA
VRKRITAFIDFFHFPFLQFIPSVTFRYLFCGVSTVLADLIVYYISFHFIFDRNNFVVPWFPFSIGNTVICRELITITPKIAALGLSMIASFAWGFVLNKYVVFTESVVRGRVQLFRYSLIVGTCILLNFILIKYFINFLDVFPTVKRFMISLIVAVYSFLIQRKFTFKIN